MHYLSDYQTFNSKHELNHHVAMHEKAHSDDLTANNRTILRFIARYSVKYAGASHLKVATIAEGTGMSDRTIRRTVKKLQSLGIIEVIKTSRKKSGGDGANIYVIREYVAERLTDRQVDEKASDSKSEQAISESQPLRKQVKKNYILESARNRNNIPTPLYNALSPFFHGSELRKYVGIVFRAKTSKLRIESHTDAFTACIIDCIRRYKLGEVRNLDGYIYTSIRRLSRKLFLEEVRPT